MNSNLSLADQEQLERDMERQRIDERSDRSVYGFSIHSN